MTFADIPGLKNLRGAQPIHQGYSSDEKWMVKDAQGQPFLLRLSDSGQYAQKRREFNIIRLFNTLPFTMSRAIGMGLCDQGQRVYMLLSWVEGESLAQALPALPPAQQYRLGEQAGRILKAMHSLPVQPQDIPPVTKVAKKRLQLARYQADDQRMADDTPVLDFVTRHLDAICLLPPVYEHGDFHPGNLILTPDMQLGVIDFNRWECGDRYEEFYKLQHFGREISVPYCVGQLRGYFGGEPPQDFWLAQAVYAAHAALFSITWAQPFGQAEVDGMKRRYQRTLADYDGFTALIPRWYREYARLPAHPGY